MFETKMKAAGLSNAAIDAFKYNYEQLVAGVTGLVSFALDVFPRILILNLLRLPEKGDIFLFLLPCFKT
jgi:hypothetical protein